MSLGFILTSIQMNIPIVLIHQGDSYYLYRSLFMLNRFYKPNEIYLIGNEANKHYSGFCTHISFNDFAGNTKEIQNSFFNLSSNGADFEFICIQRWFVLAEFIKLKQLPQAIYMDSDILIYDKLDKYVPLFSGYGMTMIGISGHTNFILKPEILNHFCSYILNFYTSEIGRSQLEKLYSDEYLSKNRAGGISDMTFFTKYLKEFPANILNLENYSKEFVIDRAFAESNGFETNSDGMKRLNWKGDIPYVKEMGTSIEKFMVTIHFQGTGKPFMLDAVRPKSITFKLWDSYFQSRIVLDKAIRKVKKMLVK